MYTVQQVLAAVMSLRVTIESRSANKRSSNADDVLCCLKVPNRLLHNWYLAQKTSIVTQLNASLDALVLKDTLEKRLKNKGALIAMKLSRATRRGKQSLLDTEGINA